MNRRDHGIKSKLEIIGSMQWQRQLANVDKLSTAEFAVLVLTLLILNNPVFIKQLVNCRNKNSILHYNARQSVN